MKRLLYLFATSLLVITLWGCSDSGKLTNQKAQQAVTQWLSSTGNTAATVAVTGVLELPQENSAKADVTLSNFVWNSPKNDAITALAFGPGGAAHTYAGRADAIFIHYNDGRWVLNKIVTPMGSWDHLNIVATGDGATSPSVAPPPSAGVESKQSLAQKVRGWFGADQEPFTAVVSADEAKFVLPVGKKSKWEWNLESGQNKKWYAVGEYDWTVQIKNGQNTYWFGFSRMDYTGKPQQSGDLAALIAAGVIESEQGSGNWQGPIEAGASVQPAGENIVILISGKENVKKVFSARPKKVTFEIRQPGKDYVSKDVSVTYKN